MKPKKKINSRNLHKDRALTISSSSNQEQDNLIENNEINMEQYRLSAIIDEALRICEKREQEQDNLFFIFYSVVVLCILIVVFL